MSRPPVETATCPECGAKTPLPPAYVRELIARNRELAMEVLRHGPLPEPYRGALRFETGPPGPDGRPPLFVTRST